MPRNKRQDIINAAERVFSTRDYRDVSMDEVAQEARVSKRTIYVYFQSKEQLNFEIMIRGYRLLIDMLEATDQAESSRSAPDELHHIFLTFLKFSERYPYYFKTIFEYEMQDTDTMTAVDDISKQTCYQLGEQVFGYLIASLQRGVQEGNFRRELDVRQAALTLWASAIGIFSIGQKKAGYLRAYHGVDPDSFIRHSFDIIIASILAKP